MAKNDFWNNVWKWQNFVHYLLLAVIVLSFQGWIFKGILLWNVLKMTLVLFVGDTVVHAVFWILPKPIQWRS